MSCVVAPLVSSSTCLCDKQAVLKLTLNKTNRERAQIIMLFENPGSFSFSIGDSSTDNGYSESTHSSTRLSLITMLVLLSVRACVRVCACARMRMRMCVRARARVCVCVKNCRSGDFEMAINLSIAF